MPSTRAHNKSTGSRDAGAVPPSARKAYETALRGAGVTQDDLELLRELARQNDAMRVDHCAPRPTRLFV